MAEETYAVVGLNHIQIEAPAGCEAAARAFFGGLLGLAEIEKPANLQGRGGAWFACGAQQIHIGVVAPFEPRRKGRLRERPTGARMRKPGFRKQPCPQGHPALEVRELDAWRKRLAAAGVAITEDEPLPGWNRFYITDPWGNRIEVLERVQHQA